MIKAGGYIAYHTGLFVYSMLLNIAALWNPKAKLFVAGRKGLLEEIANKTSGDLREKIWFHCASLGEFEQARPLMERLKKDYPHFAIAVTFFSPSGYEIRKNYTGADYIFYLPIDSKRNAQKFISAIRPKMVFFVKYELWYHYLHTVKEKEIPLFLVSANFRTDHVYFKWYGAFFRSMLHRFDHIFSQNEASANLLNEHGFTNVSISKDTRFDRVFENSGSPKQLLLIEQFKQGKQLLVAGSSYTAEESIIGNNMAVLGDWKIVLAPHHIEQARIEEVVSRFEQFGVTTFSALSKDPSLADKRVLIIDNIGMLSAIYQYAGIAFIGGGFGKSGLHNTLEAAVFGMPVLFGPNNLKKFPESLDLITAGAGFVIENEQQFAEKITGWNNNPQELSSVSVKARLFITSQTGATDHIFQYLKKKRLL
jgi:3-deoxy-D-manno-octulosonic-acid transferase